MAGKWAVGGIADKLFGGKELGGDVFGNTPTLVGERGPELFVPKTDGTIISNASTKALARSTTSTAMRDNAQMITLNNTITQLVKSNNAAVQHLNTLIALGVMTERNTKGTRINVANLSGSIV